MYSRGRGCDMALTLIVGDEKRSGKELTARSLLAAAGLKALGVGREDKVAVLLPNGFEFLEAWKALGALGALAYPLSTDLKLSDLETIIQRERFKAAIVDALLPGAAVLEKIHGPVISAEPSEHSAWNRLIQRVSDPLPESERNSPPGSMFGTSGSTGVPKTVRRLPLDHDRAKLRQERFERAWCMQPGMHTVVTGPMHHQAPLYWATGAFEVANLIVIQRKFDARELLELVQEHRITHLHMVPRMFQRLLDLTEAERNYDVSSLTFVLHGTGPVSVAQKRAMIAWWGPIFREYYSTSEFGIVSLLDTPDFLERPTSVGRLFDGVCVQIRAHDGLTLLPTSQLGEIYMASDDMPPFYYDHGQGPEKVARTGNFTSVGDMGFLDDDGYLHLAGRREDKAVIAGENHFTSEVERPLSALPYVFEAAVFVIPDLRLGDAFAANIVLRADAVGITEERVKNDLSPFVSRLCLPRAVEFVAMLPRSDSGKTFRRDLVYKGVRVMETEPTPLPPSAPWLGPSFPPGVKVIGLDETESTNTVARELATDPEHAPHLTLVWAKRQTAGRGRQQRTWISPEGNLFWSMLLRPQTGWGRVTDLVYVTALAVHAAVRPHVSATKAVTLKWPNDTLIDGRKVSGILLEAADGAVVVGVGINVAEYPVDGVIYPATSLRAEGSLADRDHMLGDLTASFLRTLDLWSTRGFAPIRDLYHERAHALNERITVRISTKLEDQVTGIFDGIDPEGLLLLRLDDKSLRKISAGDVFFRGSTNVG
jgi:long-chain acyl-CoA synthetase